MSVTSGSEYWTSFTLDEVVVQRCENAIQWGLNQNANAFDPNSTMWNFGYETLQNKKERICFRALVWLTRGFYALAAHEFKSLETIDIVDACEVYSDRSSLLTKMIMRKMRYGTSSNDQKELLDCLHLEPHQIQYLLQGPRFAAQIAILPESQKMRKESDTTAPTPLAGQENKPLTEKKSYWDTFALDESIVQACERAIIWQIPKGSDPKHPIFWQREPVYGTTKQQQFCFRGVYWLAAGFYEHAAMEFKSLENLDAFSAISQTNRSQILRQIIIEMMRSYKTDRKAFRSDQRTGLALFTLDEEQIQILLDAPKVGLPRNYKDMNLKIINTTDRPIVLSEQVKDVKSVATADEKTKAPTEKKNYWDNFQLGEYDVQTVENAIKHGFGTGADPKNPHCYRWNYGTSNTHCSRGLMWLARGFYVNAVMVFQSLSNLGISDSPILQSDRSRIIGDNIAHGMREMAFRTHPHHATILDFLNLTSDQIQVLLRPHNQLVISPATAAVESTRTQITLPVDLHIVNSTNQPIIFSNQPIVFAEVTTQDAKCAPGAPMGEKKMETPTVQPLKPNVPKESAQEKSATKQVPKLSSRVLSEEEWKLHADATNQMYFTGQHEKAKDHLLDLLRKYNLRCSQAILLFSELAYNQYQMGLTNPEKFPMKIQAKKALANLDLAFFMANDADRVALLGQKATYQMALCQWATALNTMRFMEQYTKDDKKTNLYCLEPFEIVEMKMKCRIFLAEEEEKEGNIAAALSHILAALNQSKEYSLTHRIDLQHKANTLCLRLEKPNMDAQESFLWLSITMPKCQSVWNDYTEGGMNLDILTQKLKGDRTAFPGLKFIDLEVLDHHLQKLHSRLSKVAQVPVKESAAQAISPFLFAQAAPPANFVFPLAL